MTTAAALALSVLSVAAEPASGLVNVPEGALFYEARGAGPAIVFLHDGLLASNSWDRQVPAFAPLFRVIRYDRRGYGRSRNDAKQPSDLEDLLALFDALKVRGPS